MDIQNNSGFDGLFGALIGLARAIDAAEGPSEDSCRIMIRGLCACADERREDAGDVLRLIEEVHAEKKRLVPHCSECAMPCGRTDDFDVSSLRAGDGKLGDIRLGILSLSAELAGAALRGAYPGCDEEVLCGTLARALFAAGEDWDAEMLEAVTDELKELRERI